MQFVREHLRGEHNVSELFRRFGINRKTGYKCRDGSTRKAVSRACRGIDRGPPHSNRRAVPT